MTQVNVYLNFPGTTEEAFQFYRSVFGGEFSTMMRFSDLPGADDDVPAGDRGKIMHIALPIGGGVSLMATDALESMGHTVERGNACSISIHPESRAEADRLFAALSAGGEVEQPMADQAWGDYWGACADRFGVRWMVNYAAE